MVSFHRVAGATLREGAPARCGRALLLFQLELFVDDSFERFERLRPGQETAVDEKGRRPVDTRVIPRLLVCFDDRLVAVLVDTGIEAGGVHAQIGGRLLEIRVRQLSGLGEQPIVIRPELTLFVGALGRFGGRPRLGMVRQIGRASCRERVSLNV